MSVSKDMNISNRTSLGAKKNLCYNVAMKLDTFENQNVEFKKSWRDEYLKWICAFANTAGGILYVGVDDDGTICGLSDSHKLTEDIPNKIKNTMGLVCNVQLLSEDDKEYFKIEVEKYPFPVSYHGKYYKRSGTTLQELTGVELDKMILFVQGRTWDSVPVPNITVGELENDAFRELLLNAVVHKDYLSTTPVQIRIYKDKIRLWNDGALPKEVPLESLFKEHISKPRNPNLANIFFKCGMIESWGRGFEKIAAYCKEENAKIPEIDLSLGGITVRCFASEKYVKFMNEYREDFYGKNDPVNDLVNDPVKSIYELLKIRKNLTYTEIASHIGKSEATVKRYISKLKKDGFIERKGSDKSGYWIILK